jgi:hypothetical protein
MSQTWFVYFIDHFGAKNAEFLNENRELNTYTMNIRSFESPISSVHSRG